MTKEDTVKLTFWEHTVELLHRIRIMLIAVIVSTVFVMIFPVSTDLSWFSSENYWYPTIASFVIRKMQNDFLPPNVELLPLSWVAPLEVYIIVSIMLGVLISLPVIAYELHKFINPALYEKERKALTPFVLSFISLFIFGFALGYIFVVRATMMALLWFTKLLGLPPIYEFTEFFWLAAGCLLVCGLVFTFPIYFVLLVNAGILKTQTIAKNRRYIYPALIVGISIIDPDPSLITETFVGIPVIILIEVSMLIARRYEKKSTSV